MRDCSGHSGDPAGAWRLRGHVCAYDRVFDVCANGEETNCLAVVDEHAHGRLGWERLCSRCEAGVLIDACSKHCNTLPRHRSLACLTALEFRQQHAYPLHPQPRAAFQKQSARRSKVSSMLQQDALHSECGTATLEAAGGGPCGTRCVPQAVEQCRTIPERLRKVARHSPDRLALFDARVSYTYGELDRRVDRVASAIVAQAGPGPEPVLLLTGIDAVAIVAALGIMRAGKSFVGIEPALPSPRVAHIAEDCGAALVVASDRRLPDGLGTALAGRQMLDFDDSAERGDNDALPAPDAAAVALLNYTSGSTGAPKGVVYTHGAAMAQVLRYADSFLLGEADRHVGFGALAWSGACWDAFGPLCVGASAGVYDLRREGLHDLPDWIDRSGATVLSGMMIVRAIGREFPDRRFPRVRLVQLGGDTVYRLDVETCQRLFPNAVAAVGYGITEAGRVAQQFVAAGVRPGQEVLPLGYPLAGVRVLILDDEARECAPGEIGEIAVQSADLASSYLGAAKLTAARFRQDLPCGGPPVYLTGDLGRQLPDGSLQHAGRRDFQIKVHGHRVSAAEVEAALLGAPGVAEACVVVHGAPGLDETLVAFVVRNRAMPPDLQDLPRRLRGIVPDHMVPRRVVELPVLPRTPTGKIDRRLLQQLPLDAPAVRSDRVAPRTPVEARVAAIWGEVMGTAEPGVDDDFLSLGGDSLQAMQIVSRIRREYGLDLPLVALLQHPTVARMAAAIATTTAAGAPPPVSPGRIRARLRKGNP
jgi:amino acid adenylation domain-containing protein